MTEREYDRMLDVVQDAITGDEAAREWAEPVAANDNDVIWPLLPFPEGWTASP
jgi:hypothetical protein